VPSTPLEHTAQTQTNFHVNGWAAGPCKLKTPAELQNPGAARSPGGN